MMTAVEDHERHGLTAGVAAGVTAPESAGAGLRVVRSEAADPLSKCVADALTTYLLQMDGHRVTDLHRLVIEEVERPLFETVVRHTEGNLTLAARMLGLTRSTLRKRLAHYHIGR